MTRISEELLVRHCSPTLAGLKTGNIFCCEVGSRQELRQDLRELNNRLRDKGLRIIPLKYTESAPNEEQKVQARPGGRALIYVYRPDHLTQDLEDTRAGEILATLGYEVEAPNACLARLRARLAGEEEFPHEVGLFLSYPPEDVKGFMECGADQCKHAGCWKVYGDAERAERTFCRFRKCTGLYLEQLRKGKPVERLAVRVS